jgi:hypothetical protein
MAAIDIERAVLRPDYGRIMHRNLFELWSGKGRILCLPRSAGEQAEKKAYAQ